MRVLLVANFEPDGQESMLRYAAWLERALKARGYSVDVISPAAIFCRLARSGGLKKYLGYLDKFLLFSPRLHRLARSYDLVHVLDHSNSMYISAVRHVPNLITCHDVLAIRAGRDEFPLARTGWSGRLLQNWILSGLREASRVLCVSANTARDLEHLTGGEDWTRARAGRLRVIHNALNWSYKPGAPMPAELLPKLGLKIGEPFLLHVGGNQWYKNRPGVLRIFAALIKRDSFSDAKLIMAGKTFTPEMHHVILEEGLGDRVREALNLTNTELEAVYGSASALLFPSLEEGFGWPILEAQACGCPVITSRRPPMSEVAGEAAILIDPENHEDAALVIEGGLQNREQLVAAGFRNLARFEEQAIVDQYCAFYEEIARDAPARAR